MIAFNAFSSLDDFCFYFVDYLFLNKKLLAKYSYKME